jgi:hypothetical protein
LSDPRLVGGVGYSHRSGHLLPDAAREAHSLTSLHRFGWLIGKHVKRLCRKAELSDRNVMALEREPAEPSDRGTLVAIGIAVSQHQADAQRVVKGYLWKLTGRGEHEVGVPRLERASEASVWTAGVTHCERMFAMGQDWGSVSPGHGRILILLSAGGRIV